MYGFVDFLVVFYWLFSLHARRNQCRMYRLRMGQSYGKALWSSYQNMRQFGKAIIDRFAVYAGHHFKVEIENKQWVDEVCNTPQPLVILTAHLGNFELAGYFVHPGDRTMQVLLYSGEKEVVLMNRAKFFSQNNINILFALSDMNYLYEINNTLEAGQVLGVFADRNFGSARTLKVNILGKQTNLPLGPFRVALLHDAYRCAMFAVRTGKYNYKILVTPLLATTPQALAEEYVAAMEEAIKQYPYQWFNFFDFWREKE